MENIYSYSLLQYRHSQLLGEVLNIGILVYYHNEARFDFYHPSRLSRLRDVYPDVSEKFVGTYLKAIEERVNELNESSRSISPFDHEAFQANLLPVDGSALQFSAVRKGVLYTTDTRKITEDLKNLYFIHKPAKEKIKDRFVKDKDLMRRYKTTLQSFDAGILEASKQARRLYFDYRIAPQNTIAVKFDIAWQNGTLNLVKPVSFDLESETSLMNKAHQYLGQFLDLEGYAVANNARFDLLLAKPSNAALFRYYDKAVELLDRPNRVQLIEENELEEYSEKTVQSLRESC